MTLDASALYRELSTLNLDRIVENQSRCHQDSKVGVKNGLLSAGSLFPL